ncbi:hypothetical protein COV13_03445 [Candidatus Woesearchaeota archaeon CG10_big_fil_rev_8_21_14_0_10_32_9]|nr:MAG: hypothetical protein COV13_03445 [Candidatus Woesearchaeota archaeon CG10_big_fil_rev_8_21_14_0_10_32_9]
MAGKLKLIKNPKEERICVETRSALVSRRYGSSDDEYMTLVIKLFKLNNPHKTQEFPTAIYEFSNTEKVRIRRMNVSYYLEGNDIVINDLKELLIVHEGSKIILKGYQLEVESRTNVF